MGVRGLLHRNPQFLYLHHSSDGTVKAQNSMQLPSADCATNCANGHVSRHSLWEVALSIWRPPRGMIALSEVTGKVLGRKSRVLALFLGQASMHSKERAGNASEKKMKNLISLNQIFSKVHLYLLII